MEEQDIILQHKRKRKKHKIILAIESIVTIIIALIIIITYFTLTKNDYNKYSEKAKVNYKVYLKENEFYEDKYIDEKTSVVASLIENIEVDFKYNLDLEQEQEYIYSYKILAKTNVKETKRANSIYETTEEIISKEKQELNSKNLEISERVNINYNEYNAKINKFINIYNLDNTTNTLELDMYVYVINKYDGEQINKESKVMTLNIPLTTKTVDISIGSNVIEDEGQILILIIGLIILVKLIKYMIDTRSAETMYDQELKRILFDYKSYIQTTNNDVNPNNYKTIQINTFNEILRMRDILQAPILMYTEEGKERTKFMIVKDGMLYIYVLGAKEIRNELRAKSAEEKKKKDDK